MKKMLFVCAFLIAALAQAETAATYWNETQYTHKDLVAPTAAEGTGANLTLDGWIREVVVSNVLEFFTSIGRGTMLFFR